MNMVLDKTRDIVLGIGEAIATLLSGIFQFIVGAFIGFVAIAIVLWLYDNVDSTIFGSLVIGTAIVIHALVIAESK